MKTRKNIAIAFGILAAMGGYVNPPHVYTRG